MEFKELAKEFNRMCDHYSYKWCETKCKIRATIKDGSKYCTSWIMKHPDKAEEIVSTWAKEHPVRTYLMDFREKFPLILYKDSDIYRNICRKAMYGQHNDCVGYLSKCNDCWNEEIKK